MIECVLDSSVLLAMSRREPGAEAAKPLLARALVSSVNHAEIITKLTEWDPLGPSAELAHYGAPYIVADFDADLAFRTGLLRDTTKALGLSLGDRACLALAMREKLPAYTADKRWAKLKIGVEIRVIR